MTVEPNNPEQNHSRSAGWGLRGHHILISTLPTLIAGTLLAILFIGVRFAEIGDEFEQHGQRLADNHSRLLATAMASSETDLQSIARQILDIRSVRSVSLYDEQGQHRLQAGPTVLPIPEYPALTPALPPNITPGQYYTDQSLRTVIPLRLNSQSAPLGWLDLELSLSEATLTRYRTALHTLLILLGALGLNIVLSLRFARRVGNDVDQLREAIARLKAGELNTPIAQDGVGELGLLQQDLQALAASIAEGQQELQQNVDQATEDLRETLETIEIQNIELDLARKEALEASRIKSEFLANMSHEIRTPLNGVIGFTNLLLKSHLDTTQRDYLETIQKSSQSLLAIINDILDFSKIEAGKLTLDLVPLNLQETIEDVLTMLAPLAYEKRLEQVSLFYSDVPNQLIGDPLRLKQILTNLVNNALKFTEEGDVVVRVMLEDQHNTSATIRISVTDTGIGLTPDHQQHLFNAFRQADTTTARRFGGTGLGLVISKHLVEQMRGQIGLESEPGKGSTFWFTFMADIQDRVDLPEPLFAGARRQVAVYDANPSVRLALKNLLEAHQIMCREFTSLPALNGILNEQADQPDAVLLGISVQQPLYLDTAKLINEHHHHIPFLLLGNHADQLILKDRINDNLPPLVSKPVNHAKLVLALTKLLTHEQPLSVPPRQTHSRQPTRRQTLQVMAVDDNPANLKLITALLADLGVAVTPCDNGFICLELFDRLSYDLILMDIQMPEMDGLETTRRIRLKEGNGHHTPIIAVTAHAMASEKKMLLKSGMDDYVTKPINETQLIHIIKRWTGCDLGAQAVRHQETAVIATPTDASVSALPVVDQALGLKLANGKIDLANDMLNMLFAGLREESNTIQDLFQQAQWEALLEVIHKLHGATRYTGVPRLQLAASKAEEQLKQGAYSTLAGPVEQLLAEIQAVLNWQASDPGNRS